MMRAQGRRVAVVAALLGLLALLSPSTALGALRLDPVRDVAVATALAGPQAQPAHGTALVGDAIRSSRVAVRTTTPDRAPVQQLGGWTAVALLVLAAALVAVVVRRTSWRLPRVSQHRPSAPRAPPALASC